MKICVYGCGAIGSLVAARLSAAGNEVCAVARGEHLAAIQSGGLTLLADGTDSITAGIVASDDPALLGEQDFVFLTMKSHAVPAIADAIEPLLGEHTAVVTATNGIPWWYFRGVPNVSEAPELRSVDPGKKLWRAIGPERALGCVVYPAAVLVEPGVVKHVFGDRFAIGEPDGASSQRIEALANCLQGAGFVAPIQEDIRGDIWTKLVANAAFNPVSVITGKTLGGMIDDEATCNLLRNIMEEVTAVADAYGVATSMTADELIDATRQLGAHKTSMLQDFEAGRALELGPIVGAVRELGALRGVAVPNLTMVYQLVQSGMLQHE
jgi:2-dehydropantoate 2-reductase